MRAANTIPELIRNNCEKYNAVPFINYYDEIITYGDLEERTNAFAAFLTEAGIKKGDIVSFMLGNTPAFFYTFLGIQKSGAASGPVSCWWQADEVKYLINHSKPKVIVIEPEYSGIISEIKDDIPSVEFIIVNSTEKMKLNFAHQYLPEIINKNIGKSVDISSISEDDTASVLYTSGTTGKPKGVMLSHKGIITGARIKVKHVPVEKGEIILCVLPLFHSGGLNDLALPSIYSAATIILRKNFSASEFWECVEKYQVNGFYIVPTMWNILLKAPEADIVDTSSLRVGLSGAAPIPPSQLAECESRFQVSILEAYGSTENSGGISANMLDKRKYGSIGTPLSELEVKIINSKKETLPAGEIGEILVKGATVMKGYFNNPDETAKTIVDGWLYTGDVGYLDEENFLFIVDRIKEMIIRGGVNLYPKEIELVICTHEKVSSVAVIPEAHDTYGQVAKACIVPKRGELITEEEIRKHCKSKIAEYKIPEHFLFRESLPTNILGKVLKKDLITELLEEDSAGEVPVGHFFESIPERFVPENAENVEGTVSYNITGKGGGKWTVTIKDQKCFLSEEILKEPTVYIVSKAFDYNDIVTGKIDGVTAVMTGKLKIEGDINFMSVLKNIIKPVN